LLGGWFGLHKFMEKKIGLGILYLLTFGIFGIGWIIDCIVYGSRYFKKSTPQKVISRPIDITEQKIIESEPVQDPPTPQTITPEISTPTKNTVTHKVTGMEHYMSNIMRLASKNEYYSYSKQKLIDEDIVNERVYQFEFYPCKTELIPEPDNPYDPNAVKVIVDGEHVGYIKRGSCSRVLKLLREDMIEKIETEIKGGKYKVVLYDYEDTYTLEKDNAYFSIHLHITLK